LKSFFEAVGEKINTTSSKYHYQYSKGVGLSVLRKFSDIQNQTEEPNRKISVLKFDNPSKPTTLVKSTGKKI